MSKKFTNSLRDSIKDERFKLAIGHENNHRIDEKPILEQVTTEAVDLTEQVSFAGQQDVQNSYAEMLKNINGGWADCFNQFPLNTGLNDLAKANLQYFETLKQIGRNALNTTTNAYFSYLGLFFPYKD